MTLSDQNEPGPASAQALSDRLKEAVKSWVPKIRHALDDDFGALGAFDDLFSVGGHRMAHFIGVAFGRLTGFGERFFLLVELLGDGRALAAGAFSGRGKAVHLTGKRLTHGMHFGEGLLAGGADEFMLAAQAVFNLEVHVGCGIDHVLQFSDLIGDSGGGGRGAGFKGAGDDGELFGIAQED